MAFKSFKGILGSKNKVDFEFVDIQEDEAQRDGSTIVRFILAEPLAQVLGRRLTDRTTQDTVTLSATDVEMISMGAQALDYIDEAGEKYEKTGGKEGEICIDWKVEGKSGHLKSNVLQLDVSQQAEVWLVKEKLGAFGRRQRQERNQAQRSAIVQRMRDAKTRRDLGNVDPNAGTGDAGAQNAPENTDANTSGKPEAVTNPQGNKGNQQPVKARP